MFVLRYSRAGVDKTFTVGAEGALIGRLPSCDLALDEAGVSRRHASLRVAEGKCFVRDVGSRYGTFHNGTRLDIEREVEISPGDTLGIGEFTLTLDRELAEGELLSDDHMVVDDPHTIFRPVAAQARDVAGLIRLLAEVGRTMLGSSALADVLNRVVDVVFTAVPAERAFLMLREGTGETLAARVARTRTGPISSGATLSRSVVRRVIQERVAMLAADATTDPGVGVTESIAALNIRSFMCAPLWNRDDVIGVLYVDSSRRAQFTSTDLDAFSVLANAAAVSIEQTRLSSQLLEETRRRERLQRYHSPAVVNRILQGESDGRMEAQERDVTVMFCDLVGFTTLCEGTTPNEAAALLNAFLTRMTDKVFEHEGTLDKFVGDALLAVFGAPLDQPEHARRAVEAALAMRQALAELNAEQQDKPPLAMRIAINTGNALTGDVGSPKRREFTVLGDVVNTAARLESEVAGPGEIVMSGVTYERVRDHVTARSLGPKKLRGRAAPLEVFVIAPDD